MKTREIGTSGIQASVIGLGCNNFGFFQDPAQADACVHAALDAGITFFDMAAEHGAGREEELVGAALGARRKDVIIATKFGQHELMGVTATGEMQFSADQTRRGASRRWILQSAEESLRRLRTDYIDLYQLHALDPDVAPEETMGALDELVRHGKVRAIGFAPNGGSAADLERLQAVAAANGFARFAAMQAHFNMLERNAAKDILPALRASGLSLLPYWPLANGLLTGKYGDGARRPPGSRLDKLPVVQGLYSEDHWRKVEGICRFATERDLAMVDVAFAWLLADPTVTSVIAGASGADQVRQNAGAAQLILPANDLIELEAILV